MDVITQGKIEDWFNKYKGQAMEVEVVINQDESHTQKFHSLEEILSEYEGLDGSKILYFPI